MLRNFLTMSAATVALTGALLIGDCFSGTFSQIPQADAVEITCADGSQPTCTEIVDSHGRVVGYSCICG